MIDIAELWELPPARPISLSQFYRELQRLMQFSDVADHIAQEKARQFWISSRYREHNAGGDGKPGRYNLLQGPLPEQSYSRYSHSENFFWRWVESCPLWVRDSSERLLRIDDSVSRRQSFSYREEWRPDEPFYMMKQNFRIWLDPANRFLSLTDAITGGTLYPFYSVSKSMEAAAQKAADVRAVVNQLAPFDGQRVFLRHEDIPSSDDLKRAFWLHVAEKTDELTPALVAEQRKMPVGGRPRKMEPAYEAYTRQFPNGHIGYPWKSVLERLRVEEGVAVSEGTLRAAIAAYSDEQMDSENI